MLIIHNDNYAGGQRSERNQTSEWLENKYKKIKALEWPSKVLNMTRCFGLKLNGSLVRKPSSVVELK